MPGTFFGLEIGRRGVQAHRRSLDVTGHNLANASTQGYSRQEAVPSVTDPFTRPDLNSTVSPGQFGSGVKTDMIRRIRDEYLDPQVRSANKDRYYWEDQIFVMNRVEACFAEPASSGIADQMVEFFKSWQNLNNNPMDPGVKASVVETGAQLSSLMNYTYKQLTYIQESIVRPGAPPAVESGQLKDQVARINDLLVQIQNLTADIMKVYRVRQQPNDLLDKRDMLLDELSRYGPLAVSHRSEAGRPTGEIAMNFFGMVIATAPPVTVSLSLSINQQAGPEFGHLELHEATLGRVVNLTAEGGNTARGGSLLGLEKVRRDIIAFKDNLNAIAVNIRDKIRDKNFTPPPAATPDFFLGSLDSGDFRVNGAIVGDISVLDGTKAGLVSGIRKEKMGAGREYTLEDCYGLLVTDVGNKARGADGMAANQQAIQEQMYNLREAVSGVSVDEELARMVQFQYGFQASSRVVALMDELLNEIVNRLKPV